MQTAQQNAKKTIVPRWLSMLTCLFACSGSVWAQSHDLGRVLDDIDNAEKKLEVLAPRDRMYELGLLRNKLERKLASSKSSDEAFTSAEYRLAGLDKELGQYAQAEAQYLSTSKQPDAGPTMQMQALIDAYKVATKAAKDPALIDTYLVQVDIIYSASKSSLGDQFNYWEQIELAMNGLRMDADLAHGDALAKSIQASDELDKQGKANSVRVKWLGIAIDHCGQWVASLHGDGAQRQAAWLRSMNTDATAVLFTQAQLIARRAALTSDKDQQSRLTQSEIATLEAVVSENGQSPFAQNAAAMLFKLKSTAIPPMDGEYALGILDKISPSYEPLTALRTVGEEVARRDDVESKVRGGKLLEVAMDKYKAWYPKDYQQLYEYEICALVRAEVYLKTDRPGQAMEMVDLVPHPGEMLVKMREGLVETIQDYLGNVDKAVK